MRERGILEGEVTQTIESGQLVEVRQGRHVRRQVFKATYLWHGKQYPHKEVTVVYVEETGRTTVLTSIARYGRWGTLP